MAEKKRNGFTTGSCAAAAAKAACYMLLSGNRKNKITIQTPKGIEYSPDIVDISRSEDSVSCAVRKDAGDDPDVTDGMLIYAEVTAADITAGGDGYTESVSRSDEAVNKSGKDYLSVGFPENIEIRGGIGIGTVTKPGLDQPVGNAAINSVPREMIRKEVSEVMTLFDCIKHLIVTIYAPEGEARAAKTFNPRLGIMGGISILGTSGIVEPMSEQALLESIKVEIRQRKALGESVLAIAPGNYGQEFMKKQYGYDLDRSVKISNFIRDSIEAAVSYGFRNILLTGHLGKLVKVAGGIANTHSRYGDCRMEIIAAACIRQNVDYDVIKKIINCVTTEEAVNILTDAGCLNAVMNDIMQHILDVLGRWTGVDVRLGVILYTREHGLLAEGGHAGEFLQMLNLQKEELDG